MRNLCAVAGDAVVPVVEYNDREHTAFAAADCQHHLLDLRVHPCHLLSVSCRRGISQTSCQAGSGKIEAPRRTNSASALMAIVMMRTGDVRQGFAMATQRYKLIVAYRGTRYHGWQAQPAQETYGGEPPPPAYTPRGRSLTSIPIRCRSLPRACVARSTTNSRPTSCCGVSNPSPKHSTPYAPPRASDTSISSGTAKTGRSFSTTWRGTGG